VAANFPEDLVERLDFRDKAPEVIDLSPEGGVVKMLKESMIDCVMSDKVRFPSDNEYRADNTGSVPVLLSTPIPWSIISLCRFHRRYQTTHASL